MEVTNIKKRMAGGADNRIERCLTKDRENNSLDRSAQPVASNAAEDLMKATCNAIDTPNGIRDQIGSEACLSSGSLLGVDISTTKRRRSDGPICFCPSVLTNPGKTNAGKVDEMIDYALKNLNEAEKGLSNLGDNFEHDLRLMFMDIMGRVQHWVSVVQNRIDAARADIESLKKETVARVSDLTARDLELVELRRRLNEAEKKLAVKIAQDNERLVTTRGGEVAVGEFPGQGSLDQGKGKVSTSVQTISNGKNAATFSTGTVCHSIKDSEKTERETELEVEIVKLREKNESMIKEREEYENAIQCALLRGVSSLNLEAFKVLRCPPPRTGCCEPCVLMPVENSVLCRPSSRATPQPAQRRSNAISKDVIIADDDEDDGIKRRNGEEKKSCCLSCSTDEGNKIPVENNVILLLHHGDAAAGNFHCIRPCRVQPPQPQPIINGGITDKKEGGVCVGGKCKKSPAIKTPRIQKSPAISRPGSCDFFARNKDDPASEKITTKKNNTPTIGKRCNLCTNRNNRK